jgi:DNA-directed RNA polymerase subunit RPC12/RpoP
MKLPSFDIDLDKHYNATVVIACMQCGHENRHHLKALSPDHTLRCQCGSDISMNSTAMLAAQRRVSELKQAYRIP